MGFIENMILGRMHADDFREEGDTDEMAAMRAARYFDMVLGDDEDDLEEEYEDEFGEEYDELHDIAGIFDDDEDDDDDDIFGGGSDLLDSFEDADDF